MAVYRYIESIIIHSLRTDILSLSLHLGSKWNYE